MKKPSFALWGAVQSTAMARQMLYEEERSERLAMPHVDHWVQLDQIREDWTTLELDVGSVMGFREYTQDAMADRVRAALEEVARICKSQWGWNTSERTIYDMVKISDLNDKLTCEGGEKPVPTPIDHRKFLTFNFASRDDAMLVRMSVADLRSVKNVDGGGMPQEP